MTKTLLPVRAAHHCLIEATPEKIWSVLSDIPNWPNHFSHVSSVSGYIELQPGKSFRWRSGGFSVVSTFAEITPFESVVWTGKALGTQALHSWCLSSQGAHTRVETEESFDGWLVKLMPRSFQRMLDTTLIQWLSELKQRSDQMKD
jgi:hypothetical protein